MQKRGESPKHTTDHSKVSAGQVPVPSTTFTQPLQHRLKLPQSETSVALQLPPDHIAEDASDWEVSRNTIPTKSHC